MWCHQVSLHEWHFASKGFKFFSTVLLFCRFLLHTWAAIKQRSCLQVMHRHSIPVQNEKICSSCSGCGNIYLCFPQLPVFPFYCKYQILCWFEIWTQENVVFIFKYRQLQWLCHNFTDFSSHFSFICFNSKGYRWYLVY